VFRATTGEWFLNLNDKGKWDGYKIDRRWNRSAPLPISRAVGELERPAALFIPIPPNCTHFLNQRKTLLHEFVRNNLLPMT
jgi:hypothetical protein